MNIYTVKKNTLKKIKTTVIQFAPGAVVGGVISFFATINTPENAGFGVFLLNMLLGFVLLGISLVLHIFIHEIGHLIGGKMSGYNFDSIRFFNLTFIKKDGKLMVKKFNIVGAPGQCLMSPPKPIDGKYPYLLYNLSGALLNIIFAIVAVVLYVAIPVPSALWWVFIPFVIVGIVLGIMQLVPMQNAMNDGHNVKTLRRSETARQEFWLMLHINAQTTKGARLRDIVSEKDFEFLKNNDPSDNNTGMDFFVESLQLGLLLDNHRFEEAKIFAENLLKSTANIPDIYLEELSCELLFLELIGECRKENIEKLYTNDLKEYINATSSYMSRQRLLYAYAKLHLNDDSATRKALEDFNKTCQSTPFFGQIEGERELMQIIDDLANTKETKH